MTNPALSDPDFLVGTWQAELTHADWLAEGRSLGGETRVDWPDGFFLALRRLTDRDTTWEHDFDLTYTRTSRGRR